MNHSLVHSDTFPDHLKHPWYKHSGALCFTYAFAMAQQRCSIRDLWMETYAVILYIAEISSHNSVTNIHSSFVLSILFHCKQLDQSLQSSAFSSSFIACVSRFRVSTGVDGNWMTVQLLTWNTGLFWSPPFRVASWLLAEGAPGSPLVARACGAQGLLPTLGSCVHHPLLLQVCLQGLAVSYRLRGLYVGIGKPRRFRFSGPAFMVPWLDDGVRPTPPTPHRENHSGQV